VSLLYKRPTSLEEALEELSHEDALILAGGQSLVLLMNTGLLQPERLVALHGIDELHGVHVEGDHLDIGALCTHDQLARHPDLRRLIPAAARMFNHVGNIRVRSAGTLGGNLVHADPAQDPPVMLTALDARTEVAGPTGTRDVAVHDVALGPLYTSLEEDEILTRVRVPLLSARSGASYLKFLPGTQDDYATVSVAANLTLDEDGRVHAARLAAGAAGPKVVLLEQAAERLLGQFPTDEDVLHEAAAAARDEVSPTGDQRGSADYKRAMTEVITRRAVRACAAVITAGSANQEGGRP
jgi:aerobic carbon-monoxide dehydrogenase medium subunit